MKERTQVLIFICIVALIIFSLIGFRFNNNSLKDDYCKEIGFEGYQSYNSIIGHVNYGCYNIINGFVNYNNNKLPKRSYMKNYLNDKTINNKTCEVD